GRRFELLLGGVILAGSVVAALVAAMTSHWVGQLYRGGHVGLLVLAVVLVLALALAWFQPVLSRLGAALRAGERSLVGPVVGSALGGMLLFDALVASAFHWLMAVAILLLVLPARLARRMVTME
ncbi:MAG: hypothetical protein ACYTF0_04425, partial [Planctomycetota bacterium]